MIDSAKTHRFESRWPVVFAVLAVIGLLALLPGRLRLFPIWLPYVAGAAVIVPAAGVALSSARAGWLRAERAIMMVFVVAAGIGILANLANLIGAILRRPNDVSGMQLLASSIGVWVTNVLNFSLVYWRIDRGGPEARLNDQGTRPDWLFPQEGAPPEDVTPNWHPAFVDYLYLGFSTATAFSTTDAMPLTVRAKLMMMLESAMSLATIVIVASRAINILGN